MPTSTPGTRQSRRISFGQNFLRNRRLVRRLVEETTITTSDVVVEIGPGRGIITDALSARCRHVLAIEKDPHHAGIMRARSAQRENVIVFGADILTFPLPATPYKVFSSIPFNITAAIVGKLTSGIAPPEAAWLVMQREAADRYLGNPIGTLQSVRLHPWFSTAIVHTFRRQDFVPMPQVECVLLHLERRAEPFVPFGQREYYEDFMTALFSAWKPTVEAALITILPKREVQMLRRKSNDAIVQRPSQTPLAVWVDLFHHVMEMDDPHVWQRCHAAAARVRQQQEMIPKRTQTTVRRR